MIWDQKYVQRNGMTKTALCLYRSTDKSFPLLPFSLSLFAVVLLTCFFLSPMTLYCFPLSSKSGIFCYILAFRSDFQMLVDTKNLVTPARFQFKFKHFVRCLNVSTCLWIISKWIHLINSNYGRILATRLLLVKCYDKKWLSNPTTVSSIHSLSLKVANQQKKNILYISLLLT